MVKCYTFLNSKASRACCPSYGGFGNVKERIKSIQLETEEIYIGQELESAF